MRNRSNMIQLKKPFPYNRLISYANFSLSLVTLIGLYCPNYPQSKIVLTLGLLLPYLLISHLFFIIYWLVIRPKMAIGSLVILLISIPTIPDFFIFSFSNNQSNQQSTKVVSYNIEFAYSLLKNDSVVDPQQLKKFQQFLIQLQPLAMLCLQDIKINAHHMVHKFTKLPYYYFSEGLHLGVYSAFPIINSGTIPFPKEFNGVCIWADVAYPKDTIRVYNFHLQSNRPWGAGLAYEDSQLLKRDKLEILRIFYNYPGYSRRRAKQIRIILAHIEKSPYPVILCGDLNDTPQSLPYSYLKKQFKDTFKEAGFGFGNTHEVPGLRIDYIFVDKKMEVSSHKVYPVHFSDHLPVEAQIYLPN